MASMENADFYRETLKEILKNRQGKNKNYSMRALARDLGVDHSYLARFIKGHTNVTPKVAYKMAVSLGLEGHEMLNFILPSLKSE